MIKYKPEHYQEIYDMLKVEGVSDEEMVFEDNETYVLENGHVQGFFTLYEQHGDSALAHLCVKKENRDLPTIIKLLQFFESKIERCYIHSDKEYLDKLLKMWWKIEPYASDEKYKYYVLEVRK